MFKNKWLKLIIDSSSKSELKKNNTKQYITKLYNEKTYLKTDELTLNSNSNNSKIFKKSNSIYAIKKKKKNITPKIFNNFNFNVLKTNKSENFLNICNEEKKLKNLNNLIKDKQKKLEELKEFNKTIKIKKSLIKNLIKEKQINKFNNLTNKSSFLLKNIIDKKIEKKKIKNNKLDLFRCTNKRTRIINNKLRNQIENINIKRELFLELKNKINEKTKKLNILKNDFKLIDFKIIKKECEIKRNNDKIFSKITESNLLKLLLNIKFNSKKAKELQNKIKNLYIDN